MGTVFGGEQVVCGGGSPASTSAVSKEYEQPIKNPTWEGDHSRLMSVAERWTTPSMKML